MWNKQQVAVVISFIVTNCFIQISCNITSNHTSSGELIDNIVVVDNSNNNNHDDKNEKHIAVRVASKLSKEGEGEESIRDDPECYCYPNDRDCFRECLGENDDMSDLNNMFLLTAGEVLLGCAIIMGLSALVTMMLRVCTRSRSSQNRRNNTSFMDAFERNDNRASLTSLQQSVIIKMRDRPPSYETRHNYEYQRREQCEIVENCCESAAAGNGGAVRNVPILNPGASSTVVNEPPPPYENSDENLVQESPPAYTITLPTDNISNSNNSECVGGITNQSFICNENQTDQNNNDNNNNNNNVRNENTSDNGTIYTRNIDTTVYI